MERRSIDHERAVVADDQMAEIPQPCERPFDYPTPFVAPKNAAILWWCSPAVQAQRRDQHNAWFFRLRRPLFCRSETAVQKRLAPFQLPSFVQLAQERSPDFQPNPLLLPIPQSSPAS